MSNGQSCYSHYSDHIAILHINDAQTLVDVPDTFQCGQRLFFCGAGLFLVILADVGLFDVL